MDTNALKKFSQAARNLLIDQVRSRLQLVLDLASPARREHPQEMKKLDDAIAQNGKAQVIEQVAYTWFNRFTALRFMDVNGYTKVGVVSPAEGQTHPEILAEAMAGNLPEGARAKVAKHIEGRTPSNDPQAEAYRLLLAYACNQWHDLMPFLFEKLDDYTELLMPEDLLSQTSILARLREVMTNDACQDVEIIGWLYQFYISEKKDQVFADLKKKQKITAKNIPAATQLFTPHWIVRYLVENSLGRLWMLNRPRSRLAERMDYYITPEEPEKDFLKITHPEEIRICDPAAGSGHMLTYAFDLLYAIYDEEGYDLTEIPRLILTHNLTGVEIDNRAGALAAFALMMKAAAKLGRRRFLRMEAEPDICVLQDVSFTPVEIQDVAAMVGKDLFTDELCETLGQFEQAKNFGSLIVPKLRDPTETLQAAKRGISDSGSDLLRSEVQTRVVTVLRMAEALSPKYHVVVANPPYMGGKGMNGKLGDFLRKYYSDVKSDLFSAFIIRNCQLALGKAQLGFMTPYVWMFISSYEKLRLQLLEHRTLTSLIQLEYSGFEGATVPICTFTLENTRRENLLGSYVRLSDFKGAINQAPMALEAIKDPSCGWFYRASTHDFERIPGIPISYWISDNFRRLYETPKLGDTFDVKEGVGTRNDDVFMKMSWEVSKCTIGRDRRWTLTDKAGDFRKWYMGPDFLMDWEDDGRRIRNYRNPDGSLKSRPQNISYLFRPAISWGLIGSGITSFRWRPDGYGFVSAAPSLFGTEVFSALPLMNSKVTHALLQIRGATLNMTSGVVSEIPYLRPTGQHAGQLSTHATQLVRLAKWDWNSFEPAWDFTSLPLLSPDNRGETLEASYTILRTHWQSMTEEMHGLEEENNRIFIDAYGLQDELTPEVPIKEITLTCNPAYRYGVKGNEEDRETRLCADTMAEFLSYAVGCMFGRYSLDAPGLILANQGERRNDYLAHIPEPSFMPDKDNVIPVLNGDWFPDDITERFRLFLRVTFSEAHFRENLRYIEKALGKDIRKYFTKSFYADHVARYKKRPIYWMFSSPKGTFNALIYMHRYRADTVSVLLNDYLREFISKLEGERGRLEKLSDDLSASQGQRTKALKEMAIIAKQIDELNEWERDVVFPLAQAKIEIDLDDGVKANYPKFGAALKKVPGLEAKND